jgi:hypothetical protein
MDKGTIAKQIYEGQLKIPEDKRLSYIKEELTKISDINARSEIENIVFLYVLERQIPLPKIVVILIHGIRTFAPWQELIRDELDNYNSTITYPIGYDYFDAFRFWCPIFTRKKPVNRVLNELRGIQLKHRNDKICVIAHSYGTYIISQILLHQSDIQIDRLLLCGSVISQDYGWEKIVNYPVSGILNDCGSKDIWPVLAKSLSWGYGASGTYGFKTHKVYDRFHDFGHSDFFKIEFIKNYWIPYIVEKKIIKSPWDSERSKPCLLISTLSWLPLKTLAVIFLLWTSGCVDVFFQLFGSYWRFSFKFG